MANLQQESERGYAAQRLLEEPLWAQAWERLEADALKRWRTGKDTEEREQCWLYLKVLNDLRKQFEYIVKTGELAQEQLKRERN